MEYDGLWSTGWKQLIVRDLIFTRYHHHIPENNNLQQNNHLPQNNHIQQNNHRQQNNH